MRYIISFPLILFFISFQHILFASDYSHIAEKFSPIIFQEVDRGTKTLAHKPRGREDFISAVNYDGDLQANNNWENINNYPLLPVIYYSLLETSTHYFISYSIYHPRDWNRYPVFRWMKPYSEHENDMENTQVVVRKAHNEQPDKVILLLTQEHLDSDFAKQGQAIQSKGEARLFTDPILLFNATGEIDPQGTHAGIFVERKGHGIYSVNNHNKIRYKVANKRIQFLEKKRDASASLIWESFPIVQYTPAMGREIKEPAIKLVSGMAQRIENNVAYQLQDIYATFWTEFESGAPYEPWQKWKLCGDGHIFDKTFVYQDQQFLIKKVPRHFDADMSSGPGKTDAGISMFTIGLCVNPAKGDSCQIGTFFFNPANSYPKYFNFSGTWSTEYLYNPYLNSTLNHALQK